jgi:hypothetical protein
MRKSTRVIKSDIIRLFTRVNSALRFSPLLSHCWGDEVALLTFVAPLNTANNFTSAFLLREFSDH